LLGDIVISKEKVVSQACEYGHSIQREFAFLIAHSMLHLMGYDHMEEEERGVMEQKQKEILDILQISR
jgi:probable rRNA maturation factor